VFGLDFQGRDFIEDSTTVVLSRHGAKIRLTRKLIPEMEIRIVFHDNTREWLFRVVGQAGEPVGKFSFWGIECLEPADNIYETGVAMPAPLPSPRRALLPSPELAPKPVPQLDAKLSSLAENIYETGFVMPGSERSPRPASLPSPELAPKPVPQRDAKLSSPAENVYETGIAMPASEPSPRPALLPSPELAPKPVPQLDAKLSSPAENIYETGDVMPGSERSPRPAPLPSPALAPKPVPQLDAKLSSKDTSSAEAWLRCAECGMRELVELDKMQIRAMRKLKGLVRSCPACGATTLWRRVRV
jgi:hypothetical protein